jgi:hypothetical protein
MQALPGCSTMAPPSVGLVADRARASGTRWRRWWRSTRTRCSPSGSARAGSSCPRCLPRSASWCARLSKPFVMRCWYHVWWYAHGCPAACPDPDMQAAAGLLCAGRRGGNAGMRAHRRGGVLDSGAARGRRRLGARRRGACGQRGAYAAGRPQAASKRLGAALLLSPAAHAQGPAGVQRAENLCRTFGLLTERGSPSCHMGCYDDKLTAKPCMTQQMHA